MRCFGVPLHTASGTRALPAWLSSRALTSEICGSASDFWLSPPSARPVTSLHVEKHKYQRKRDEKGGGEAVLQPPTWIVILKTGELTSAVRLRLQNNTAWSCLSLWPNFPKKGTHLETIKRKQDKGKRGLVLKKKISQKYSLNAPSACCSFQGCFWVKSHLLAAGVTLSSETTIVPSLLFTKSHPHVWPGRSLRHLPTRLVHDEGNRLQEKNWCVGAGWHRQSWDQAALLLESRPLSGSTPARGHSRNEEDE